MTNEEDLKFELFADEWPFAPAQADCEELARTVHRHGAAVVLLALRSAVRTEAQQTEDPLHRLICEDFDRRIGPLIDEAVDAHHQLYNPEAWGAYLDRTPSK